MDFQSACGVLLERVVSLARITRGGELQNLTIIRVLFAAATVLTDSDYRYRHRVQKGKEKNDSGSDTCASFHSVAVSRQTCTQA
jgi:hypothetical protein